MKSKQMTPELKAKFETLTEMEKRYFMKIWPQYGVLYLQGEPGVAKSAIARSIANKMGFKYIDFRLSMVDEIDLGLYPYLSDVEQDGKVYKVVDYAVPKWAIDANKQFTIIHFDELNRAQETVRNAALQLLLERQIGSDFYFNDKVFMMASGNLGENDNTDVQEFDAALKGRLIPTKHIMEFDVWKKNFGDKNIHPLILAFLEKNVSQVKKNNLKKSEDTSNDDNFAYPSYRTWTFFSEYIKCNFGDTIEEALEGENYKYIITEVSNYVGSTAGTKFIEFIKNYKDITIMDIIENYSKYENLVKTATQDKKSFWLHSLAEVDLIPMPENKIQNFIKFMETLTDEEKSDILLGIIDERIGVGGESFKTKMSYTLPSGEIITRMDENFMMNIITKTNMGLIIKKFKTLVKTIKSI